jgi:hypothetical protein
LLTAQQLLDQRRIQLTVFDSSAVIFDATVISACVLCFQQSHHGRMELLFRGFTWKSLQQLLNGLLVRCTFWQEARARAGNRLRAAARTTRTAWASSRRRTTRASTRRRSTRRQIVGVFEPGNLLSRRHIGSGNGLCKADDVSLLVF